MKSYLKAVEAGIRRIDRLLRAADRHALHAKVAPLLERYRAKRGNDDTLLRRIVAAFRAYPEVHWPLFRDLHRIDPKRWPRPVAKGRGKKVRKLARPKLKKAAGRRLMRSPSKKGRASARRRPAGSKDTVDLLKPRETLGDVLLEVAGSADFDARASALDDRVAGTSSEPAPRLAATKPQPEKPRWIIAQARDLTGGLSGEALRAFRAGERHEIRVHIGVLAKEGQLVAEGASAADSVVREGESYDLEVVFFVPALRVSDRKPLHVPAYGDSKPVAFRFKAGEAGSTVQAFVSLMHGGRVLQTALLAGDVVADPAKAPHNARLTLRLQIVVPGFRDATRRAPFDAALVAVNQPSGRAAAAGVSAGGVVVFDSPALDDAGSDVRKAIARVVGQPESFRGRLDTDPGQKLLWELAQYGVQLHDAIGAKLKRKLAHEKALSRLQIVQTSPNAFIPLEFVYDLPAPANGAKLCLHWQDALLGKPCPPHEEDARGNLKCVCPSGFWGITKVIERQVLEEVTAEDLRLGRGFGIRVEPTGERPSLPPPSGALFAWSEILDNLVHTTSKDLLKALNDATAGRALPVATWDAWAQAIAQRRPGLLVLLSHTITAKKPLALQIGAPKGAEQLTLAQVNEKLVRKDTSDAPIVILLGCDTAAESEVTTFVGRFRDNGAAVVVGTITPVLGEHSASVVQALLVELSRAAAGTRGEQPRFGELMRNVRRHLLAQGELTALCATSFGDADWGIGRAVT